MWSIQRLAVMVAVASVRVWQAGAQETPATPEQQRIEQLEQRIRVLERKLELSDEKKAEDAKKLPVITASGKEGFSIKAPDDSFKLRVGGYVHADGRYFFEEDGDDNGTSQFLMRRVRPILEGTVFKSFDYRVMPDFGGGSSTLQDAYMETNFWPAAKLRLGKFKPPFGLERLQSATAIEMVERALPTNLVPNRDVGLQLGGEFCEGEYAYAVGIFNGVPDGGSGDGDNHDDKDVVARFFAQPFKNSTVAPLQGLGAGVAVSYGNQEGTPSSPSLPTFRSAGQLSFFNYRTDTARTEAGTTVASGDRVRLSPQATYYYGPFGLQAEYVLSSQEVSRNKNEETLDNEAWQTTVSYVLTGEDASYKGVTPRHPFDLTTGDWGAFELVGRVSQLEVDDDAFPYFADPTKSAQSALAYAVGLNWYLNKNVKFVVDYEHTQFDDGATGGGDRSDENAVFTRAQVAF